MAEKAVERVVHPRVVALILDHRADMSLEVDEWPGE